MARQFNLKYVNGDWATSLAAAGTTQATATAVTADHVLVTTVVGADGVRLVGQPDGAECSVANATTTDGLLVYPPTGAAFNGQTANDPINLPEGKAAWFKYLTSTKILAVY